MSNCGSAQDRNLMLVTMTDKELYRLGLNNTLITAGFASNCSTMFFSR